MPVIAVDTSVQDLFTASKMKKSVKMTARKRNIQKEERGSNSSQRIFRLPLELNAKMVHRQYATAEDSSTEVVTLKSGSCTA